MKKIILIVSCLLFLVVFPISIKTQPPKLRNYGSSCYVNAIIQALNATNPLTELIPTLQFTDPISQQFQNLLNSIKLNDQHAIDASLFTFYSSLVPTTEQRESPSIKEEESSSIEDIELKRALEESLKQYGKEQGKESELVKTLANTLKKNPEEIKILLNKIQKMAEEQDASEFLDRLISSLQGTNEDSINYKKISDLLFFKIKEEPYIRPQLLLFLPTFAGNEILNFNQVERGESSDAYSSKGRIKILSKIQRYASLTEMLNKQLYEQQITQPSPILLINLLRFGSGFDPEKNDRDVIKLSHKIEIPFILSMTKFIEGTKNTKYDLYAAINHQGPAANSGHYVAYVKLNNQWYLCNDSAFNRVTETQAQQEINKDGYILFYQQIEEAAQEAPTEEGQKRREEMQEAIRKQAEREKATRKLLIEKIEKKEQKGKQKEADEKAISKLIDKLLEEEKKAEELRKKRREEEEKASLFEAQRIEREKIEKFEQERGQRELELHKKALEEQRKKEQLEAQRSAQAEERRKEEERKRSIATRTPVNTNKLIAQLEELKRVAAHLKDLLVRAKRMQRS